jgi:hypothetical protein
MKQFDSKYHSIKDIINKKPDGTYEIIKKKARSYTLN